MRWRPRADGSGMKKGNLIASIVIGLWGAGILLAAFFKDDPVQGGGGYGAGQTAALVFAIVMVVAGVCGVRIELRRRGRSA